VLHCRHLGRVFAAVIPPTTEQLVRTAEQADRLGARQDRGVWQPVSQGFTADCPERHAPRARHRPGRLRRERRPRSIGAPAGTAPSGLRSGSYNTSVIRMAVSTVALEGCGAAAHPGGPRLRASTTVGIDGRSVLAQGPGVLLRRGRSAVSDPHGVGR
jgi:hypothetical protein